MVLIKCRSRKWWEWVCILIPHTIRPHSSLGYRPPAPESIEFNRLACVT